MKFQNYGPNNNYSDLGTIDSSGDIFSKRKSFPIKRTLAGILLLPVFLGSVAHKLNDTNNLENSLNLPTISNFQTHDNPGDSDTSKKYQTQTYKP